MSDSEIEGRALDTAVAERVMGWRWIKASTSDAPIFAAPDFLKLLNPEYIEKHTVDHDGPIPDTVPRYSSSIAAAYKMETALERRGLADAYTFALFDVLGMNPRKPGIAFFLLIHASPLDRCKAALKTVSMKG